ncbi:hypothetical protein, partial [Muricomes intestini]|uniref:hypothetical protein n=1 Tax=Muricomes intestini TaxID=1796634 RepID=UPI002FE37660
HFLHRLHLSTPNQASKIDCMNKDIRPIYQKSGENKKCQCKALRENLALALILSAHLIFYSPP